jgi:hypothetical protein
VDFAQADAVAATVTRLLPPSMAPLFGPGFTRSDFLFDEYVHRLTVQVVAECGLERALAEWSAPADVAARGGLDPHASAVPLDWMLRHLARRGVLASDAGRFRAERALAVLDPADVVAEQRRHDAACVPSYALAETAAREYPAYLRGERSGEEILLAPRRLSLWTSYFSGDNPLYAVNNGVGAAAVEAWMPAGGGTLLELGGGLGSGALALLDRLGTSGRAGDIREYRFTEMVPAFLRRGERLGGRRVLSECIRPRAGQTIYPEFIFNLMQTFRARGFLTPEQWSAALDDAGFAGITFLPDVARIREVFPGFYAAAIGATRD